MRARKDGEGKSHVKNWLLFSPLPTLSLLYLVMAQRYAKDIALGKDENIFLILSGQWLFCC